MKTSRLSPLIKQTFPRTLRCRARHVSSIGAMAAHKGANKAQTPGYIDIGINLADPVYRGVYRGKEKHPNDLKDVIQRARQVGCTKMIVTGSNWDSILGAEKLAKDYPGTLYYTAGIHPCSSNIFSFDESPTSNAIDPNRSRIIMTRLQEIVTSAQAAGNGQLVALGEFGLDYDRLQLCSRRVQQHSFSQQLKMAAALPTPLPLFLHSRAAAADFVRILREVYGQRLERLTRGAVVHSFTGTLDEMHELLDLGLYIGINGCSLKTEENIAVVRRLPLDRIMLETDGPWCTITLGYAGWNYVKMAVHAATAWPPPPANTEAPHPSLPGLSASARPTPPPDEQDYETVIKTAGRTEAWKQWNKYKVVDDMVLSHFQWKKKWRQGCPIKGRNEPCNIDRVAMAVAAIQGITVREVCEAAWNNTTKIFALDDITEKTRRQQKVDEHQQKEGDEHQQKEGDEHQQKEGHKHQPEEGENKKAENSL